MADVSAKPTSQDLFITRGDTFLWLQRLWSSVWDDTLQKWVKDQPLNLTGYAFSAQVKADKKRTATTIIEFTPTILNQADLDNGRGYFTLSLTPTQTSALGTDTMTEDTELGVWDLEVTEPDGTKTTIFDGKVTLRLDVTRAA